LRESVGDPIIDFDGFQLKKVTVTVSPVFWMVDAFQKLNTLILQKPRSTNKQQKHLVLLHSSHQKTGFSPQYLSATLLSFSKPVAMRLELRERLLCYVIFLK
jgi:hypothetical protein